MKHIDKLAHNDIDKKLQVDKSESQNNELEKAYNEVLDELYKIGFFGMKLGLENIERLCQIFHNPERSCKVIHIAGTNGKGSTSTIIEKCLIKSGFKVGKYTSPHLIKLNERFSFNGEDVSDADIIKYFTIVKEKIKNHDISPTFFEIVTIMMFLMGRDKKIDYLVLETGLGGRLDATNVVNSDYAVITNIGLDHIEQLGDTLKSIAAEKAGIIKEGSIVVIGEDTPELVEAVLQKKSKELIFVKRKWNNFSYNLDYKRFITNILVDDKEFNLALFGDYQAKNFLTAYTVLNRMGIDDNIIKEGAKEVFWPGRFEIKKYGEKLLILDGAHNSHGMREVRDTIKREYNKNDVVVLTSILLDKDIKEIAPLICDISNRVILTSLTENSRGSSGEGLQKFFDNSARVIEDTEEALKFALKEESKIVLVCGSFYLLGKVKELLIKKL